MVKHSTSLTTCTGNIEYSDLSIGVQKFYEWNFVIEIMFLRIASALEKVSNFCAVSTEKIPTRVLRKAVVVAHELHLSPMSRTSDRMYVPFETLTENENSGRSMLFNSML